MSGYAKLFSSIIHSSIWCEDSDTSKLWITILAMKDKDGFVDATIPGLAKAANISVEKCKEAIIKFESPDEFSRNQELEGRRLISVDGGWIVVNHEYYKYLMSSDEQRERWAAEKRKQRLKNKQQKSEDFPDMSDDVQDKSSMSAHTDTDTDTDILSSESYDSLDTSSYNNSLFPSEAISVVTNETSENNSNRKRKRSKHPSGWSAPVWEAYAKSYETKYSAAPVSGAKNYALCTSLREKLGDDAIAVAEYYPRVEDRLYINGCHPLELLVRDAQKIHTMWKKGLTSMASGTYYGQSDPNCRKENIPEL